MEEEAAPALRSRQRPARLRRLPHLRGGVRSQHAKRTQQFPLAPQLGGSGSDLAPQPSYSCRRRLRHLRATSTKGGPGIPCSCCRAATSRIHTPQRIQQRTLCAKKLTVDASAQRNCAALINDYRGRDPPTEANVRVVECYVDGQLVILLDNVRASSCC